MQTLITSQVLNQTGFQFHRRRGTIDLISSINLAINMAHSNEYCMLLAF